MATASAATSEPPVNAPTWRLLRAEIKVISGTKVVDGQTGEERPGLDPTKPLRIAGVANANVVDRVNEVLDPRGCILTNYTKNPVFLCDHDYRSPLGTCPVIEVKDDGVHFEAEIGRPDLAPLTDLQIERRSLIAQGILKTVSVGFIPLEMTAAEYDDAGNLTKPAVFTKWELLEISLVSVPCNADAIFHMKEFAMSKVAAGAAPMSTPATVTIPGAKVVKDGSPAPGTGQGDEPPTGSAGEMLKAILDHVGKGSEYLKAIHEGLGTLHAKVDALKPADEEDPKNPDENTEAVTQTPAGTTGKPEPVKAYEARLTKLEESLGKLADGVAKLAEKLAPANSGGRF